MNKPILSYTIKWSQTYHNWEVVDPPINDFTEALAVINMIRSKL
jgi:hypothetical protein